MLFRSISKPAADAFAPAYCSAGTDVEEMAHALQYAGANASAAGLDIEQTAAFIGVLGDAGITGSKAGTALNAMLRDLKKNAEDGAIAVGKQSVALYDANGNMRPMPQVISEIIKATEGMSDAQRDAALSAIFGEQALGAFNAIARQGADAVSDLASELYNAGGTAQGMADVQMDNLIGALTELGSAFEGVQIALGSALIPIIQRAVEWLTLLAEWFNSLSDDTKTTVALFIAIASALMLITGSLLLLIGFIPQIIAGFTMLTTVIGALTGPITLLIAGFVAVGVALVVAYNKFEWFRDMVSAVWGAIVNAIKSAIDGIVSFVNDIATQISTYWIENGELIRSATENVWNVIKTVIETAMTVIEAVISAVWFVIQTVVMTVWENIKGVISGALDVILGLVKTFSGLFTGDWQAMWDGVKQLFSGSVQFLWNLVQLMLWGRLLKGLSAFVGSFRGTISTMWATIRGLFTSAINAIRNVFTSGFNAMRNVANTSMSSIRSLITSAWNAIRNTFTTVVNGIRNIVSNGFNNVVSTIRTNMTNSVNVVRNAVSRFFNAGRDLIRGLIDGIKDMTGAAISAITGVVDGVVEKAKSLLKIASPSRVFDEIGQDTIKGYERGVNKRKRHAEKEVEKLFKQVLKIVKKEQKDARKNLEKNNKKEIDIEKRHREELLKIAEKYVEDKRKNGEMSLQDEIYFWNAMYRNAKKGSESYEKSLENHQKAVKQLRSEIESINKEYNNRIVAINKEYNDEVKRLNDEFQKEYDDHLNKMLNFVGLFDEFSRNMDVSGYQLIYNLESQIEAIRDYDEVINSLSSRIDDESLINELKNMGIKAVGELQALNSLSDEELEKYVTLYQEKFRLAKEYTDNEMRPLLDDTNEKLERLKKDTGKRLDEVNEEWQEKIRHIVKGVDKEFDSMYDVGIDAMKGLSDGMESMRGPLLDLAKGIARDIKSVIADAFDIRSPSRWMRDMIGKNMMQGWIDGILSMKNAVINMSKDVAEWMTPEVPEISTSYKTPSIRPLKNSRTSLESIPRKNSAGNLNITNYFTPAESTPSESARKQVEAWRRAALELM